MTEALALYKQLKNTNITTGKVDGKCLSQLLDTTIEELKSTKSSEFVNKVYTACMQYAFFPEQNKKTMSEIRVHPESMAICGTDAVLIMEMMTMKTMNKDCEGTEEYKKNLERLFSKYSMKPSAARRRLLATLEKMNIALRQQGALAHFGRNADMKAQVIHRDRSGRVLSAHRQLNLTGVTNENLDEKSKEILKQVEDKCNNLIAQAKKDAATIVAQAREEANAARKEAQKILQDAEAKAAQAQSASSAISTALESIKAAKATLSNVEKEMTATCGKLK